MTTKWSTQNETLAQQVAVAALANEDDGHVRGLLNSFWGRWRDRAVTKVGFNDSAFTVAARSGGAVTPTRLIDILKGATPKGPERFCLGAVLAQSTPLERLELASCAGLRWKEFAWRFQCLTGISRHRAQFATSLYPTFRANQPPYPLC